MSPTLAQVNGPGPSPASLFDTVLNLPGDEAVITGETGETIGGVPGETTQLNVSEGGTVGFCFEALSGSEVNINGGTVNRNFKAKSGSEVNISGGTVGSNFGLGIPARSFAAESGSVVNISGGTVGNGFIAFSGSEVNISGGTVEGDLQAGSGSVVNISGGDFVPNPEFGFGGLILASSGSVVNIFGSDFLLDNEELDTLVPGEVYTITDRDVRFSGSFADGERFFLRLTSYRDIDRNFFDPNATLTVTLVSPVVLGDVNLDGVVTFLDIAPFIGVLSAATFQAEADCDQSGMVDFLDIQPFIEILSSP